MTVKEIEEMINIYGTSVYSFCCYLTGSREKADDLYQNILLKALEMKEKIAVDNVVEKEKKYLRSKNYLLGIGIRLWKKEKAKSARYAKEFSLDDEENGIWQMAADEENVEGMIEKKEMTEALYQVVNCLPEKMRIVVLLHYTGDMKVEEIAKELKIPKGTVKSRLHHARIQIRKEMEDRGYEL